MSNKFKNHFEEIIGGYVPCCAKHFGTFYTMYLYIHMTLFVNNLTNQIVKVCSSKSC